jgi:hypothetical protein
MIKPSIEERLVMAIQRISISLDGLSARFSMIENDRKFPIVNPSEEFERQMKESKKDHREEKQLSIAETQIQSLVHQNKILIWTLIANVIIGILGIIANSLVLRGGK